MKLKFPCDYGQREYDSEKDGNVWCWKLLNHEHCDHAAECMCIVEKELVDVMHAPKKTFANQELTKEKLVKELELQPEQELAEAS